jgi:hypothetical protein
MGTGLTVEAAEQKRQVSGHTKTVLENDRCVVRNQAGANPMSVSDYYKKESYTYLIPPTCCITCEPHPRITRWKKR